MEAGQDPAEVVPQAAEAARVAAQELGMEEEEAATALAIGLLDAAAASGEEALAAVREALPPELAAVEGADQSESQEQGD